MPERTDIRSVLVIGAGIEHDRAGTSACRDLKAKGLRVVVVEPNPATIMTDPDVADATYLEPVTVEHVGRIIARERPAALLPTPGGRSAHDLAIALHETGVLAAHGVELTGVDATGPLVDYSRDVVRPVLPASAPMSGNAVEITVDALHDGHELHVGGVLEHLGRTVDSACALPPITLGRADLARVRAQTDAAARELGVRGLVNVRFALAGDALHVLETHPGASRTVTFTSKATGVPLAAAAARIAFGATIAQLRDEGLLPTGEPRSDVPIAVREPMSSGEVMGIDPVFGAAYAKARIAAHGSVPTKGRAFLSVAGGDLRAMVFPARVLAEHGFELLASPDTAEVLERHGISATVVGDAEVVRLVGDGQLDLVVDTSGRLDVPCVRTFRAFAAIVQAVDSVRSAAPAQVMTLQELHLSRVQPAV